MYRKILLASVGAIALTGSAALAADLPSRAPPPVYLPPPPLFTWTGIYIGGQVGGAWGTGGRSFTAFDAVTGTFVESSSGGGNPGGVIGGGHIGYDYQIPTWNWLSSSGVVIGLEGSIDGSSLSKTTVVDLPGAFGGSGTLSAHTSADIQGSIRGRLGMAWDRVLVYGTGGVAFGGITTDFELNAVDAAGVPFFLQTSRSNSRTGWTVGGGIEYAVTNNWSVGVEYRYTDFGTLSREASLADGSFINVSRTLRENQVQARFSYKFDTYTPPPVVAKY
ncbi:MAG TPA: outer membrane beta-barrel protein [Methylocella sp.]|jgi:outer membrane immunogenic protein